MRDFYIFAAGHPLLTLVLAFVVATVVVAPFKYAALAVSRYCRSRNIAARGWPQNPLMDADGDIVHPKGDAS